MSAMAQDDAGSDGQKWKAPPRGTLEVSNFSASYETVDDLKGNFGRFGGQFIPETLMHAHKWVVFFFSIRTPRSWRWRWRR